MRNLTIVFAAVLCGCGGGGSSSSVGAGNTGSSGGSGGNSTTSALSVSILAPSVVTVGSELGTVTLFGQGFTVQSEVLIDGKPVFTSFANSTTVQAEISPSLSSTVGTHQFSVQNGGTVSNSLTFTIYAPQQGG
jgi:hypothetical protein